MRPQSKNHTPLDQKNLEPIECAGTNLRMASRVVARSYDAKLSEVGLNISQYAILTNIGRYQPISQIRLADHLDLERTTLYRALDILEKKKLVTVRSAGTGVAKYLELTKKGLDLAIQGKKSWRKVQADFEDHFGEKRWDEFTKMLSEMRDYFRDSK